MEWSEDQEPTFYAVNNSLIPQTVTVTFSNIKNSLPPSPNPIVKTVKPGTRKIIKLKKSGLVNGGVGYNYTYNYKQGCMDTKPKDLAYLLPIKQGNETNVGSIFYIGEIVDREAPDGFYALSFSANNGDNVYSVRGGTVVEIVDQYANE